VVTQIFIFLLHQQQAVTVWVIDNVSGKRTVLLNDLIVILKAPNSSVSAVITLNSNRPNYGLLINT